MFEQKKKVGTEGKGGKRGRGHKVNACMLYNTKTETLFSFKQLTLQSFPLFICLLLH